MLRETVAAALSLRHRTIIHTSRPSLDITLPMATNWKRFYEIIRAIPPGRVLTYGDVARLAGNPRAARDVGWSLSALPQGSDVPWWRVVNREGGLSCRSNGTALQAELLREEGVGIAESGLLDLARFRWDAAELPDPT